MRRAATRLTTLATGTSTDTPSPVTTSKLRTWSDLRRERGVGVVAQIDLDDLDTGELGLVLVEVVDLLLAHGGLDHDRSQRVEAALLHLARE